jgi:hypothetical protein
VTHAHVAQLAEHVLGKDEVTGSIPVMGSTALKAEGAGRLTEEFLESRKEVSLSVQFEEI